MQDFAKNIFDPKMVANPKILREGDFQRMIKHGGSEGFVSRLWNCGLPQFIFPVVRPCPKLVDACARRFDKEIGVIIGGRIRVTINATSIWDMLCIPINQGIEGFNKEAMEEFWNTKTRQLAFYEDETEENLAGSPLLFPMPHGKFKMDL